MGGYGSWYLASTYPEKFAAMVSVSGSGFRTEYLPDEETLCKLETVPVWGIHGVLDQISMFEANKMVMAALDAVCDGEVKWTQYENLGHGGTYDRAYRDPALYSWMLEHSR
jgi:predicted peptidase